MSNSFKSETAALIMSAALVHGTGVFAQEDGWSVREMLGSCEAALSAFQDGFQYSDQVFEAAKCLGFHYGVVSMLAYNCASIEDGYSPLYRAELPPSQEAGIQAFVNWARANPAMWSESAVDGILLSYMETFPCQM